MKMEIKPSYVSFKQAKLLKEKNFDVECRSYYELALNSQENEQDGYSGPFGWKEGGLNTQSDYFINNYNGLDFSNKNWYLCARPEQWQVVEWLRINHGIWVTVGNVFSEYTHWAYGISENNRGMIVPFREGQDNIDYFTSPQEAYSAAFNYILKIYLYYLIKLVIIQQLVSYCI